jgi:hypothetical protein
MCSGDRLSRSSNTRARGIQYVVAKARPNPAQGAVHRARSARSYSVTPLHELGDGEHSKLTRVEPGYLIEKNGATPIGG